MTKLQLFDGSDFCDFVTHIADFVTHIAGNYIKRIHRPNIKKMFRWSYPGHTKKTQKSYPEKANILSGYFIISFQDILFGLGPRTIFIKSGQ